MNLSTLLADLYRRLNYTSSPPTATTTRLTAFLNETHRKILGEPGMERLRDDTLTFTSVNAQAYYGLPQVIERIESITDRTSNYRLRLLTQSDIRTVDPSLASIGLSQYYINRGFQQVAMQPAAATGLWVVSSSAGDATQVVTTEAVLTGGYRGISTDTTLNGTTRVQVDSLTTYIEVVKFYVKTGTPAGTVSLYDAAAAGNELARIPIGGTYARYLQIQLWPTPTSALTYYVDYVRTLPDMANSNDEPLVPEDFHYLLIEGTLMKELTKSDDTRRVDAERNYLRGVSQLKYFINCGADLRVVHNERRPEFSRLGANFPATSW